MEIQNDNLDRVQVPLCGLTTLRVAEKLWVCTVVAIEIQKITQWPAVEHAMQMRCAAGLQQYQRSCLGM